jgi:hypothetical protein
MNNWEQIAQTEDFIIDYDETRAMYRVSYFQDNHFVDDIMFDAYEPVRHGEWICINNQHNYYEYHCSLCGRVEKQEEPYCHCGARMDGDTKREVGFYRDPKNYNISQRLADGGNK